MARPALIGILIAAAGSTAAAQDLGQTIIGCQELSCPLEDPEDPELPGFTCTVANLTFPGVGLARIPDLPEALDGLSWTKGVSFVNKGDNDREFDSAFYLGKPSDLEIENTPGCAVFFHQVRGVNFTDPDEEVPDAIELQQGTCAEAMSQECVDALLGRAALIQSGDDACDSLQSDLEANLDDACREFAGGDSWAGLSVKSLSSGERIGGDQNSSSDCWPVTPKSDDLELLEMHTSMGDIGADSTLDNLYGVTPILTVFFDDDNFLTTSQLTCLKMFSNDTINRDDDEGGAFRDKPSSFVALGALAAAVLLAF